VVILVIAQKRLEIIGGERVSLKIRAEPGPGAGGEVLTEPPPLLRLAVEEKAFLGRELKLRQEIAMHQAVGRDHEEAVLLADDFAGENG